MCELKKQSVFIAFLIFVISCQCKLNLDDSLEDNQIEFYQNVNRKVLTTTSRSPTKFSIFQKRTKPSFRRNNKYQTFLTSYKIVSNASTEEHLQEQKRPDKRLYKSKAKLEFVDIYDQNLDKLNKSLYDNQNKSDKSDESLSHAQQTVLAFEHALKMKKQAKCELPKPTVVYLNQDKEQIKIYMPRATVLHRCGQNTGCCEQESDNCVAIEQEQIDLYFFVIKFERDFNDSPDSDSDSVRKGRKFSSLDSNDDSMVKEYEYNLDYTLNNDIENSFKLNDNYDVDSLEMKLFNQLKNENNYLNTLLNQDNGLKRRLSRSTKLSKRTRKSKDLNIDSTDEDKQSFKIPKNVSNLKRNLSESDSNGESNFVDINSESILPNRMNSKRPSNLLRYSQQGVSNRNHIRRSLSSQMRPKQTIEKLTFTNHTRCSCVNRLNQ